MTARPRESSDWTWMLGAVLAAHFLFACMVKLMHGTPWQLLWFCHVSLVVAAVGYLTRSKLLKATALTNVFVLHALWILDFAFGVTTGTFPFAFSAYVADVDVWTWLGTLHHLYLLPILLWSFLRERDYPREAWLISATMFVLVVLASRCLLSPAQNVNYAFFIPESLQVYGVSSLNRMRGDVYLLGLHGVVNLFAFFPAALVLSTLARVLRRASDGPVDRVSAVSR